MVISFLLDRFSWTERMIFDKILDRIAEWSVKRWMRKQKKERTPTASLDVPRFGQFDLIQGVWEGEIDLLGFDLSILVNTDGASMPEEIISLLNSIADNLAELHDAAQAYCASFENDVDKQWIEDCGGLELRGFEITVGLDDNDFELFYRGISWEDASVDVAFKDMKPVGHFFCD